MYISHYFFKVDEHDNDICVSLGAVKKSAEAISETRKGTLWENQLTKPYFSAVWPDVGRMSCYGVESHLIWLIQTFRNRLF